MSIKLMSQVWEVQSLSQPRKMLLLAIADFANDEGLSWPSVETLMRKCSFKSDSGVRRALDELCKEGWMTKTKRSVRATSGRRVQGSNYYQISISKLQSELSEPAPRAPSKGKPAEPVPGEGSQHEGSSHEPSQHEGSCDSEKQGYEPVPGTPDPSVTTNTDPSDKKHDGQLAAPADPQRPKIDYQSVVDAYHEILPEMAKVLEMTDSRRDKLRSLWRKFDFTQERWAAYLRYIAKHCRWMCENRADKTSGRTWRKKNFDYLITERCYLSVKEERANDLPKAGSQLREDPLFRASHASVDYSQIPEGFNG